VLQGERPIARDNRTLGKFQLVGIPPAPRGVPQIEVTFDIDANGIVNVSAKDRATGKTQNITITASSGLAKDEVEKMVREAESHSEEDKRRREEVEARNQADTLIYSTEKTLDEHKDKLSEEEMAPARQAVEAARKAIEEGGKEGIERTTQELTKVSHRLAEVLYQKSASAAGSGPEGGSAPAGGDAPSGGSRPAGDDVIDAEVVDKK
jgi:molecular chaperone DnaK